MFISKKICFLELEKTGISSINKFLKEHIKDGETTQPHNYVTEDLMKKKLFFIGSIRNPYDWYISKWSYGCMMKNEDSMYKNLVNKRLSYSRIENINQFLAADSSYILRSVRPSVRQTNVKKVYNAPKNASMDKINTSLEPYH